MVHGSFIAPELSGSCVATTIRGADLSLFITSRCVDEVVRSGIGMGFA